MGGGNRRPAESLPRGAAAHGALGGSEAVHRSQAARMQVKVPTLVWDELAEAALYYERQSSERGSVCNRLNDDEEDGRRNR